MRSPRRPPFRLLSTVFSSCLLLASASGCGSPTPPADQGQDTDGGAGDGSVGDGAVVDVSSPDGEILVDAANEDQATRDSSVAHDGDVTLDASDDAAVLVDASTSDAGTHGDAGTNGDAGTSGDAGASRDAGVDAGQDASVADGGPMDGGAPVCHQATFSGAGRVEVPTDASFNPGGSFTLEAWVAPATASSVLARRVIAAHYGTAQDQNFAYRLALTDDGRVAATASRFGATAADYLHPTPLTADTFHHVAMVVDTSAQTLTIFVDGVPGQSWFAGLSAINATAQPFTIGDYDATVTSSPFSGVIADVRLSTGTRYTSMFTPSARLVADAQTVALYPLDEAPGSGTVRDVSGNGLNGSVASAAVTFATAACR